MKNFLFVLLILIFSGNLVAQNYQAEYLEAKRLFKAGDYKSAKSAFMDLSNPSNGNSFFRHASFFYALSAYNLGEFEVSKDMCLQIMQRYPKWDQRNEVSYWLLQNYLQIGDLERAFSTVEELQGTDLEASALSLKSEFLSNKPDSVISGYYFSFPGDLMIATEYANRLKAGSLSDNQELLLQIIADNNLDIKDFVAVNYNNVKKEEYNVALLLPFRFDSIQNAESVMRNRLVMDLYEGMLLAIEKLKEEGKTVNLFPYDTKGRAVYTKNILSKPELKSIDLIIGPLFPGPFKEVYDFCAENKINMFNPISSNPNVIGNNPFSFLNGSTYKTKAKQIAKFAEASFDNKVAWVFYDQRDSAYAGEYRNELLDYGFQVTRFQELTKESIQGVRDTLSSTYDHKLETQEEIDSVSLIPGVEIKKKRFRGSSTRYSYIEKYIIKEDSLGHVFVASNSNLYPPSFVSSIITRPDSITLIGQEKWLDMEVISFSQMENMGLHLSYPGYVDLESDKYQNIRKKFLNTYKTLPSDNHLKGYECMLFLGRTMHHYGKYFQEGLRNGQSIDGEIMSGYRYGLSNDNQLCPIVTIRDSKLKLANSLEDEGE